MTTHPHYEAAIGTLKTARASTWPAAATFYQSVIEIASAHGEALIPALGAGIDLADYLWLDGRPELSGSAIDSVLTLAQTISDVVINGLLAEEMTGELAWRRVRALYGAADYDAALHLVTLWPSPRPVCVNDQATDYARACIWAARAEVRQGELSLAMRRLTSLAMELPKQPGVWLGSVGGVLLRHGFCLQRAREDQALRTLREALRILDQARADAEHPEHALHVARHAIALQLVAGESVDLAAITPSLPPMLLREITLDLD